MNICFVCNEFPPYKNGGIGTFVKEMSYALVNKGHNVIVVGIYNDIQEEKNIFFNGALTVIRLKSLNGKFSPIFNSMKLGFFVKKLVDEYSLDVIEVPDFEGINAFWPKLNIPIIVRLHGSVSYFAKEMKQKISKNIFYIEKRALKKANFICSVSKYTARETKKLFNINYPIKIIYNGIKIPSEDQCKKDFSNKFIVSFSGSLMKKKGVLSLAKAWKRVLSYVPNARLRFIGKDVFEDSISGKQKILNIIGKSNINSVEFTGHVPKKQLEKLLVDSDLAVYPSYAEAFSLAPLEAMSLRLPVIYSNRTSGLELSSYCNELDLIDPDNIEQLSNKIIQYLKNEKIRKLKGFKNREDVIKFFNITDKLEENINYYKECING